MGTTITFSGESADLVKAIQEAVTQQQKMEDASRKIKKADKEMGDQQRKTLRDAKRMYEETRTPQERYAQRVKHATALLKKGKISQDTYNRALKKAREEQKKTFGSTALSDLTKYAAGFASLTAGIGLATRAFAAMKEERAGAVQSSDSLLGTFRKLNQVGSSKAESEELVRVANEGASKYGMSRDKAANVLFNLRSVSSQKEAIASAQTIYKNVNVVDPESASQAALLSNTLFKGLGVSGPQAMNMVGSAAKSSVLSFEQMTGFAKSASESAGPSGTSPSETLAAASIMSGKYKGETGAMRIKAYMAKIAMDESLNKLGLVGATKELRGRSREDQKKWLGGNQEVSSIYNKLLEGSTLQDIETMTGKIRAQKELTGTDKSYLALGRSRVSENTKAVRKLRAAKLGKELASENRFAVPEATRQGAIEREVAARTKRGDLSIDILAGKVAAWGLGFVTDSPSAARTAASFSFTAPFATKNPLGRGPASKPVNAPSLDDQTSNALNRAALKLERVLDVASINAERHV